MTKKEDLKRWDELHANPPEDWREKWSGRNRLMRFDSTSEASKYARSNQHLYNGKLLVDLHVKDGYVVYEDPEYRLSAFHEKLKKDVESARTYADSLKGKNGTFLADYTEAEDKYDILSDVLKDYERMHIRSKVVLTMDGGVIHNAVSDYPLEVIVIDFDIEGVDDEDVAKTSFDFDGSDKAYVFVSQSEPLSTELVGLDEILEKRRSGD